MLLCIMGQLVKVSPRSAGVGGAGLRKAVGWRHPVWQVARPRRDALVLDILDKWLQEAEEGCTKVPIIPVISIGNLLETQSHQNLNLSEFSKIGLSWTKFG